MSVNFKVKFEVQKFGRSFLKNVSYKAERETTSKEETNIYDLNPGKKDSKVPLLGNIKMKNSKHERKIYGQ